VLPLIVELAEPVEDRLALVDFNAAQHVRTVADEHVGAVVDRRACQLRQKVGNLIFEEPLLGEDWALVAVARRDHEFREVLAVADGAEDLAKIGRIHLEASRSRRAHFVPEAEELHAVFGF
jgi:hypothetical protein